jgi:chemotaxis signal transduction protein
VTAGQADVFDVERLRREFDATFALPRGEGTRADADYLLIRAGGKPYAIALAEVGGVLADVAVTRVPSPVTGLLGIAGLRGEIVPVFELAALIGGTGTPEPGRWILLRAGAAPIGFSFGVLEGHVRRRREELLADGGRSEGFFSGAVEREGYWPIIGIERLVATLGAHSSRKSQGKGT